jgi:NAD(P)-dependent dehydrogenase (short-subunit alcohol dehydrogenase family)
VGNKHGRIDIVVNNAAAFVFGTVEEVSEADWDRVFDVNVKVCTCPLASHCFIVHVALLRRIP